MKDYIRFSIITPVFNRADCIERCIQSVISQNYPNYEMWIVDDGSTDGTSSIVKNFEEKNTFIRFHRFEKNKGVNAARNHAIKNSIGDFIIFLDSDDYFLENALHEVSACIDKNNRYNHYLFALEDMVDNYIRLDLLSKEYNNITFQDFLLEKISGDFTHVMNAEIVKKNLFNEYLRIYEGLNFLSIYKENNNMLFVNKYIVARDRERADSVTFQYCLNNIEIIKKKFISQKIQIQLFTDDYLKYDQGGEIIKKLCNDTYLLGLASEDYNLDFIKDCLKKWDKEIPFQYKLLYSARMGTLVRYAIYSYSYLKRLF